MPLVDYSDSEPETDGEPQSDVQKSQNATKIPLSATTTSIATAAKRKPDINGLGLPALPSKFHDLYASTSRLSTRDDPSLHGGRKRVTPHIAGNWPTHLYIEWYPETTEHDFLSSLISALQNSHADTHIDSSLKSDLGAPLPLHISLSRPIGFLTEQKDDFALALENRLASSGIRPFKLSPSTIDWVPNFEKTRWFLVLRLSRPQNNALNELLRISNLVVQQFGQPPLYATATAMSTSSTPKKRRITQKNSIPVEIEDHSAAFHISIAWALTAPSVELLAATKALGETKKDIAAISIDVKEIKAKIGNAIVNMPLTEKVIEGKGLF